MKKTILFSIMIIALVLGVWFVTKQTTPNKDKGYIKDKIVVGINNNQTKAILNIMQVKGYLEEELPDDVTLEWSYISGYANIRDSLVSGNLDFVSTSGSSGIVSITQGYPLVPIANSMGTSSAIYSKNPEIKTFEDLKNAERIAIHSLAVNNQYAVGVIAKEKFGDFKALNDKLVVIEPEDTLISLQTSKDLDVAIIFFPYTLQAELIEGLHKVYDLTPTLKEYGLGNWMWSSENFVKENQSLVEAFLRAEVKAIDFINNNREEAVQILANLYEMPAEDVLSELALYPPTLEIAGYDETAQFLLELGEIEQLPVSFSSLPNYNSIPH